MALSCRIKLGIEAALEDEGGTVFDLRHGTRYGLNAVGASVWGQLEEGYDDSEIAIELARLYRIDPNVAHADVSTFLDELVHRELVEATGLKCASFGTRSSDSHGCSEEPHT